MMKIAFQDHYKIKFIFIGHGWMNKISRVKLVTTNLNRF